MSDNFTNNNRIAKNTIVLYARMIVLMFVSLYTSRVILRSLGIEDFGIYNVVTGFVIAFGFLNSAMTASVQRFLTVEFKSNNPGKLNKVLNMGILIHFTLALIMVVITEVVGLYIIQNKLVIPFERLSAAIWIFHLSVVNLFFSIMNVPYRSLIVTHEDMGAFAIISLFEAFSKLAAAFLISFMLFDKLIMYGFLLTVSSVIIQVFYMYTCYKNYRKEVLFKVSWDRTLFSEMCNFAGWNLIGVFAGIANNQGVNVLLNVFGGPVVNAARAVAYQVSGAANQLVSNFQMAINPPIMKSFVAKDGKVEKLVSTSSKISCVLLLFIAIPIIIEAPYILKKWLVTVPNYTVGLTRFVLIDAVVCSMAGPLHTLFQATGKIKLYQILISGILLLNFPLSYMFLYWGAHFEVTACISIMLSIVALLVRLLLVENYSSLTLKSYIFRIMIPLLLSAALSSVIPVILSLLLHDSIIRLLVVVITSGISLVVTIWFIVLNTDEKNIITFLIKKIVRKQ